MNSHAYKAGSEAYRLGYQAFIEGKTLRGNPYIDRFVDDSFWDWREGWLDAREDLGQ